MMPATASWVDYYCKGMHCDCHCQNDSECEVMSLILLQSYLVT